MIKKVSLKSAQIYNRYYKFLEHLKLETLEPSQILLHSLLIKEKICRNLTTILQDFEVLLKTQINGKTYWEWNKSSSLGFDSSLEILTHRVLDEIRKYYNVVAKKKRSKSATSKYVSKLTEVEKANIIYGEKIAKGKLIPLNNNQTNTIKMEKFTINEHDLEFDVKTQYKKMMPEVKTELEVEKETGKKFKELSQKCLPELKDFILFDIQQLKLIGKFIINLDEVVKINNIEFFNLSFIFVKPLPFIVTQKNYKLVFEHNDQQVASIRLNEDQLIYINRELKSSLFEIILQ